LIYSLIVKNSSQEAIEALRKIEGVSGITAVGTKVVVEMKPGSKEIRDKIVETAVTRGMGVLEFSAERVSLEEIFLQLTTVES